MALMRMIIFAMALASGSAFVPSPKARLAANPTTAARAVVISQKMPMPSTKRKFILFDLDGSYHKEQMRLKVSSPLRPSHLASPAPFSPRHALHASLTLRFHLRPASACSSTPPHSETPLYPRPASPFLPCPQAEYDRKIREQEDLDWYVSLLCCAGAGKSAGWLLLSFGIFDSVSCVRVL